MSQNDHSTNALRKAQKILGTIKTNLRTGRITSKKMDIQPREELLQYGCRGQIPQGRIRGWGGLVLGDRPLQTKTTAHLQIWWQRDFNFYELKSKTKEIQQHSL